MSFTYADSLQFLRDWDASDTSTRTTRNYAKIINDACMALHNQGNYDFDQRTGILTFLASYDTGTVSINVNSNSITGTGTTWTSADTGKFIRINNDDLIYQFTYVSGTSGTLTSLYQGESNVTDGTYTLTNDRVALPSGFKSMVNPIITAVWFTLQPKTLQELQKCRMISKEVNDPRIYAFEWAETGSDETPIPYFWVYPSPMSKRSIQFTYYKFPDLLSSSLDTYAIPAVGEPAIREYLKAFLYQMQGRQDAMQQMAYAQKVGDQTLAAFRVNGELPQRAEWDPMLDYGDATLVQPVYLTPTNQTV